MEKFLGFAVGFIFAHTAFLWLERRKRIETQSIPAKTDIFKAIIAGDLETVKKHTLSQMDISKLLSLAVQYKKLEILKYIVEKTGSEYSLLNYIYRAVNNGDLEIFRYIVSFQKNRDCPEYMFNNILTLSVERNNFEFTKEILDCFSGEISFYIIRTCLEFPDISILKLLYERGANLRIRKDACLEVACQNLNLEAVKYLVKNGADVGRRRNAALKAVGTGRQKRKWPIVQYLIRNGADPGVLRGDDRGLYLAEKAWKKWRRRILVKKLRERVLPIYFSPGFPGWFEGRREIEKVLREF